MGNVRPQVQCTLGKDVLMRFPLTLLCFREQYESALAAERQRAEDRVQALLANAQPSTSGGTLQAPAK